MSFSIFGHRLWAARLAKDRKAPVDRRWVLFGAWLLLSSFSAQAADSRPLLRFSIPTETLSFTQSVSRPGEIPIPLAPTNRNLQVVDWTTAPQPTNHVGEFELRFRGPVSVGTVVAYEPGEVSFYASNSWRRLPAGFDEGRKLQVLPLPPFVGVEALKFSVPAQPVRESAGGAPSFQARLAFATLLPIRLLNVAAGARVTASSAEPGSGPQTLVDGLVAPEKNFATAKREATNEWLMFDWPKTQSFRGLGLFQGSSDPGVGSTRIEAFTGQGDPRQARGTGDWNEVNLRPTPQGPFRSNQFLVSFDAVDARAVRLVSTGTVSRLGLGEVAVLEALGNAPAPQPPPKFEAKTWIIEKASKIEVDGRAEDWPASRTNGFALAWDETRLYLLYQARGEASTFQNQGTNVNELFHTGDALDLQLQTRDNLDPKRSHPGPGDVRLLFSLFRGKPVCVLYDFQAEDLLLTPVLFKSSAATVSVDKVSLIEEARMELHRSEGEMTIEASVPLKALHLSGKSLKETRGDVGRIFGNGAGNAVARRGYWSTPSTNPPADLAQAAELSPGWWGRLEFRGR